jgi:GxxExxY protein
MTSLISKSESSLLYYDLTRAIMGAGFQAHTELGFGFAEVIYRNAVAALLREQGFAVQREVEYQVHFHRELLGLYRADLIVESKVVVEVKTALKTHPIYESITRKYLRASNLSVGLMFIFGPKLEFRRLIWTPRGDIAITG